MDPARWLRRRHNVFSSPLGKPVPDAYRVQVARWLLRLLGTASVETDESETPHILEMVGLAHLKLKNLRHPTAIHAFTTRLAELDQQPLDRTGTLYRNIDHIFDLIGLSEVEKEVLAFVVLHQTCSVLRDCVEALNGQSSASVCDLLALVLGAEQTEVRTVLRAEGPLCASGILKVDHTETDVNDMLSLLNGLEAALLDEPTDGSHLFRQYFKPATSPQHGIDRFSHVKDDIAVLHRILTAAREQDTQGVNILIYGVTGTGKTAFVKALADSVQVPLFEVGHEMEETNLEEKHFRFRSYLLSQKVLAKNRSSLILFDEVEDVFPDSFDPFLGRATNSGRYKSWTNTVLETNQRPAFWLCNQAQQIDPAFRRRFTYALEFRIAPRSIRRAMLTQRLHELPVRLEWIERVSENRHLTPALIEQVGKIVALARHEDAATAEALAERTLKHSLESLGLPPDYLITGDLPPLAYQPELLNPSHDLTVLTKGLKARPKGRLCFSGPPGSGKTSFAQHLSEQVDKPLFQKTASDLLDCFVGGTEKNLAAMFREAEDENAVLFLDEADSFLQDRTGAQHSWEITQVNELLKQMELFEGLFICATNLMERLDPAVLRRFDLKIQFNYLRSDQAEKLFMRVLAEQRGYTRLRRVAESVKTRLSKLSTLTPGDFATVVRQARALGECYDRERLMAALEEECRAKQLGMKSVTGFVR
jgi:SpoVK/Ycf46/Vps4 family AAA+-type ATPase